MKEKNLTELLLGLIRTRPGMYLGENKISKLTNFISGYHFGFAIAGNHTDPYFGKNGFLDWLEKKYNFKQSSSWEAPFLEEADRDESKALEIFFKYLEEYQKDMNEKK